MNAIQLQQAVNISVIKNVQEVQSAQASILLESLANTNVGGPAAPHPTLGNSLDIRI